MLFAFTTFVKKMEAAKKLGDEAFRSGDYKNAVRHYTDALVIEPRNVVLLNNRSAAYHKMGQGENALDDANKSTGIEPTARGYSRVGNAYWLLNRYEQAVMAYEKSLELKADAQVATNLAEVKELAAQADASTRRSASTGGGATASPQAQLYTDFAVVTLSVLHLVLMLVNQGWSVMCWRLALGAFGYRQVMILRSPGQPGLAFSREALTRLATHFSFQYIVLCLVLYLTQAPPQLLLLAAMCIYVVSDIVALRAYVPPQMLGLAGPYLDKFQGQRDQLMAQAAMSEVVTGIMYPLSGGGMMGMMLYWQFLKYRYNADAFSRLAFQAIAEAMGKVFYHPRAPAALGTLFTYLKNFLHKMATGR